LKHVAVIGAGTGAHTLTGEGLRCLEQAQAVFGAPRMLEAVCPAEKFSRPIYEARQIKDAVESSGFERYAVLVSGDTGFYSAAQGIASALSEYEVSFIPGISCAAAFFAKIKRPWHSAALLSCHAREANFVDAVRRSRVTFALTGGNVNALARELAEAELGGVSVTVGENLGCANERIFTLGAGELAGVPVGSLAVLLADNPDADERIRFGIPDEEFARGGLPMTKSEVRALCMSRLALSPDALCFDIGAGTGSVTVEMALAAYRGRVFAVDKNEESALLVRENCRRFHLGNVTPVQGCAPQALLDLPAPDAAFIGGSSGGMAEIIDCILAKNPSARIVVTAIALETLHRAAAAFQKHAILPEITQIGAVRAKPAGGLSMMAAQNPVFIISGTGAGA
jgi:precorrin-6Y C5,15-methyltransferase (decarboxylating)